MYSRACSNFRVGIDHYKGRGYVAADENLPKDAPIGVIPVDAIYTPIKKVAYKVENTRVGQRTDYEKLTIELKQMVQFILRML